MAVIARVAANSASAMKRSGVRYDEVALRDARLEDRRLVGTLDGDVGREERD